VGEAVTRRGFGRRALSALAWSAAASALLYSGACGPSEETTPESDIGDVIYQGGASDEALEFLLGKAPSVDASQGTVFDAPEGGASLPAATPPTFKWHVGGMSGVDSRAEDQRAARAGGAAERACGARNCGGVAGFIDGLRELAGGEREASAHGPPVNGRAYFLVFSTESGEALGRVFTTLLEYTPDAAAWGKITASGGTIKASITGAIFDNNRIAVGGGPFAGQDVTFSIAK
jgi:hypothetical protein